MGYQEQWKSAKSKYDSVVDVEIKKLDAELKTIDANIKAHKGDSDAIQQLEEDREFCQNNRDLLGRRETTGLEPASKKVQNALEPLETHLSVGSSPGNQEKLKKEVLSLCKNFANAFNEFVAAHNKLITSMKSEKTRTNRGYGGRVTIVDTKRHSDILLNVVDTMHEDMKSRWSRIRTWCQKSGF